MSTWSAANEAWLSSNRMSNQEILEQLLPADVAFYELISTRVTSSNALPFDLPVKSVLALIVRGLKFFWEWYDYGTEARTLYLPYSEICNGNSTSINKLVKMPNGIEAIYGWQTVEGQTYGDNISQYLNYALLQTLNTGASWSNSDFIGSSRGAYGSNLVTVTNIVTSLYEIQNWKTLFTKTIRAEFNKHSQIFSIQSDIKSGLVIDCLVRIRPEHMYNYYLFEDYIVACVEEQLGKIIGKFDFKYPGGVQPDFKQLSDDGKSARQEIEAELKESTNNSSIMMVGD
jgi:hypothetical protein